LKGFKTFLINRVLELIQANINFYLSKVSTFQIKMEGYKILSSGELREKITILVSKDGINWDFYEKFSGGQKTRIDICAVFALRRIINQNAAEKGGGLNFLGLDEAFDGLDASGQKHIIDTLDGIGETCLVISHSNDNVAFKNKITIGYDDSGVSKIL
jgi:DNA repair exonuclease SbcCD ATPase subunit